MHPINRRGTVLAAALALAACLHPTGVSAQALRDLQPPREPLRLRDQGSFYVGGESVEKNATQLMSSMNQVAPVTGHIVLNQMYVGYMVPEPVMGAPVVMFHGGTVMGKTYETTPDGRMGWAEYFVRKGYPVYVPDQIGRGRSGVDISVYNEVRAGQAPGTTLPNVYRHADEQNWTLWRFGPAYNQACPDTQFPVQAIAELSKQAVPNFTISNPALNIAALSELAGQLNGAVLMGHSQSGAMPLDAALLNPGSVKAMILVEPGRCLATRWTDSQIDVLAKIPTLVVFGDHLDTNTRLPVMNWQSVLSDCQAFMNRVNGRQGNVKILHPPELGIHGNTHLIMMDRNNLQIADLILDWLKANVPGR